VNFLRILLRTLLYPIEAVLRGTGLLATDFAEIERLHLLRIVRQDRAPAVTTADLLGTRRLGYAGGSLTRMPLFCYINSKSLDFHTPSGAEIQLLTLGEWHGQASAYIVAPGYFLRMEARDGCFRFMQGDLPIASGTDLLAGTLQLQLGEKNLTLTIPRRRSDWDSGIQKPSYITLTCAGTEVGRLFLQPYQADTRVIESGHEFIASLSPQHTLILLSFCLINSWALRSI
jgi:hypothetical protein